MSAVQIDYDVSSLSQRDLNHFALTGGRIGFVDPDGEIKKALPTEHHGYGFKCIPTQGDKGDLLVLIPRSNLAAEYLRQGRVAKIMNDHGITYVEADTLFSAADGIKYGTDRVVLDCVVRNREYPIVCQQYPADADQDEKDDWLRDSGLFVPDQMTPQKIDTAFRILNDWKQP